ncbi:MAG: hypothetical protein AAFP84_08510 [Actinomycetota bacterium]
MASEAPRNLAATIVGWLLVALVVYLLFGWIIGTIRWIIRMIVVLVVLGGLFALYLKLRDDGR